MTLEQVEAEKDMDNFVRDYGTGAVMQPPTPFVSYKSNAAPVQTGPKTANFLRTSVRAPLQRPSPAPPMAPQVDEPPSPGAAGVGAVGSRTINQAGQSSTAGMNGNGGPVGDPYARSVQPTPSVAPISRQQTGALQQQQQQQSLSQPLNNPARGQQPAQPSRNNVDPPTMLSIGGNAYPVDPNSDPQHVRRVPGTVGDDKDPIAQALDALRKGGGVSRNGVGSIRGPAAGGSRPAIPTSAASSAPKSRPDMNAGPQPRVTSVDYHDVANSIVGAHPASRPTSPMSPGPRAAMMQPPQPQRTQLNEVHQQAFPGERRLSINRGAMSPANSQHQPPRTPSPARDGFAGIGAQGRSPSPQPFHGPGSRAPSPGIPQNYGTQQQQQTRPLSAAAGRPLSAAGYTPGPGVRGMSPAPLGIALDSSGQVAHDSMAEEYARRNGYVQQQPQRQQSVQSYHAPQAGYAGGGHPYPGQQQQQGYGGYPQGSNNQPPSGSQRGTPAPNGNGYNQMHPSASATSIQSSNSYSQGYSTPAAAPPQLQQHPVRTYPDSNGYFPQQQNSQYGHPQQQQQRPPSTALGRSPSPAVSPAVHNQPVTPGQITDDGGGILFYGRLSFKP